MDGLALLHHARDAGLQVEAAGETLKITGPKRAEPIVRLLARHKREVLAALAPHKNERTYWQERYTTRTFEWFNGKREWHAARRVAWGNLQNEWHKLYGRRWPAWQCAGCEQLIGGFAAIEMADGNRVHFEPIDCLISFGNYWRRKANAALVALKLTPPEQTMRPNFHRHPASVKERSMTSTEGYFGLCPICHRADGYANAGRAHRFYCKEHKTSWLVGSNLFSSWRYQTEEEQHRIWDEIGLEEFKDVEPFFPPEPPRPDAEDAN